MINNDRIVPITRTDLLTLIGTTMTLGGTSYTVLQSKTVSGDFAVTGTGAAGTLLANQPVKSLDFESGVTGGTVYFVADFDYAGFKVAGADATIAAGSAAVINDGATLYKAVLDDGTVTITAVSPVVA